MTIVGKLFLRTNTSLLLAACAALLTIVVAAPAQTSQPLQPFAKQFAGTWKAEFQRKTTIILRLDASGANPSGTIQLAGFQLDLEGDGAVMAVTDERLDSPIQLRNISAQESVLSFDFVDRDGDTDRFKLELSGRNTASLVWVELPKGMKAQPIAVVRQTGTKKGKA